ncbi:MAG: hypothetical protein ACF8CQ_07680 [Rhodopirellula sp. JB044]|uniref:hypothetical protein n=1 Tax=Rhodopirellula sp. JB044 TaxID=3342844 RepID=UPI003709E0DE
MNGKHILSKQSRRRIGFLDRCLVMLMGVLLLPLPVPTSHRHDSFESPTHLAVHLSRQHSDTAHGSIDLSKVHWHFTMPHCGDDHSEHDESGVPHSLPQEYTPGQAQGSQVSFVTSRIHDVQSVHLDGYPTLAIVAIQNDESRQLLVTMADRRHRSALSCVMRC